MKKKILRSICAMLAIASVVNLTGCGKDEKSKTSSVADFAAEDTADDSYLTTDEATAAEVPVITGNAVTDAALVNRFIESYEMDKVAAAKAKFWVLDDSYFEYIEEDDGYKFKVKNIENDNSDIYTVAVMPAEYNGKPVIQYDSPSVGWLNLLIVPDSEHVIDAGYGTHTTWAVYNGDIMGFGLYSKCASAGIHPVFDENGLAIKDNTVIVARDNAQFKGATEGLIVVPEGIEKIGDSAFKMVKDAFEVQLPSTLKVIGSGAFEDTNLKSINLPEGLEEIKSNAFSSIYFLDDASLALPNSLKKIGSNVFESTKITSLDLGTGVSDIGRSAFSITQLEGTVTIPSNITVVAENMFASCKQITSVVIEEGVLEVKDGAFLANESLTSISLPESLETFYIDSVAKCTSLKEVTIPDGARVREAYAGNSSCNPENYNPNLVFKYRGKTYTVNDLADLLEAGTK